MAKLDLESKISSSRPVVALVAPDALLQDDGIGHWNTLVVRPQYKLEIRLGDIDDLFPTTWDDSTDLNGKGDFTGRKARLQVAGFGPAAGDQLMDLGEQRLDLVLRLPFHRLRQQGGGSPGNRAGPPAVASTRRD